MTNRLRLHQTAFRITGSRLFWSAAIAALFAVPLVRSIGRHLPPPPPVYATLPGFRFVDQNGQEFGSDELKGKVWVADFIFTGCGEVCPKLSSAMAQLQVRLRNVGSAAHLVSFSVDPAHDTPQVLLAYAQKYRARRDMWSFLTGPLDEIQKTVVDGFKIAVERTPVGDTGFFNIVHGQRMVLVDQEGRIRGYFSPTDEGLQELLNQLGLLANLGPRTGTIPPAVVSSSSP